MKKIQNMRVFINLYWLIKRLCFFIKKFTFVILLNSSITLKIFPLIFLYPKLSSLLYVFPNIFLHQIHLKINKFHQLLLLFHFSVQIFQSNPSSFDISFAKSTKALENSSPKFHHVENLPVKYNSFNNPIFTKYTLKLILFLFNLKSTFYNIYTVFYP